MKVSDEPLGESNTQSPSELGSFTLCSSAGLTVGECSAVMGLTPCMLCVQIYCVLCLFDYLSAKFSTVNTGLSRAMFWKA